MTDSELQLRELAEALKDHSCHCLGIPYPDYEPGVLSIICPKCNFQTCAPDFDPAEALKRWIAKLNQ